MVTLKDIAEQAGVSVMTVSRVVNGHQTKVSKETELKIRAIIKEYGYVPNYSARSLSSKSSKIIAVILRGEGNRLTDPYNAAMLGDIILNVQKHGYFPMIHYIYDYHDITARLHTWNIEGAIFLGVFDENLSQIKEDNQIPLVFTDSYSPVRQITNIGIDDYKGGVLAARHFYENGHRCFAFIGTALENSGVSQHRLKGFSDTLKGYGLELPKENIFDVDNEPEPAEKLLALKCPVTAVFTTADMTAIDLIDHFSSLNVHVPGDYSIIGFDNLPLGYYITPKLTTVAQDVERKAQLACDILFGHIEDHNAPSENIVLDVHLLERSSVRAVNLNKT